MDLDAACNGLATQLRTINSLKGRVYSEIPEKVSPPSAIVALGAGERDDFDDTLSVEMKVLVVVGAQSTRHGQERLRAYCNTTGDDSLVAAIADDRTLGGTCMSCDVLGWNEPSVVEIGGVEMLGVEFNLMVIG